MFYKHQLTFEDRCCETRRILQKYPDRVPIICEKASNGRRDTPDLDNKKYLVHSDLTVGHLMFVIRKRMQIRPEDAIFLFIGNNIPPSSYNIGNLYHKYKDKDGFLYMQYSKENTFG
jgi:GABA(A) receptor-associated protein